MSHIRSASAPSFVALAFACAVSIAACSPADPSATASPSASAAATATASAAPIASPSPTPTAAPSPTPEPEPVAASILLNGTGVTVLDASGAAITSVPFTTPGAEAAAQLADALDVDPTLINAPGDSCHREGTIYRWGGFNLSGPGSIGMVAPAVFSVYAVAATTDQGLPIYGPGDVQVGDTVADVRAQVPGATFIEVGGSDYVVATETIAGGEADNPAGVQTLIAGGSVISVASPVLMFDNC